MLTQKLYLQDAYIKEFDGKVLSVEPAPQGGFLIQLDQTAFYPEGGGQPCDQGKIGSSTLLEVFEQEGKIYHLVDQAPKPQETLHCTLDWERRFDHMQQHLGQHLLSAVLETLFQAHTIGFHLGKEVVTIDLDVSLSTDDLHRAEEEVNRLIYENLKVKVHFPTAQELKHLPLRKAPSVTENIRIVEIEGYDYSPCGGTHPRSTGELGLVKILSAEKFRDGVRLSFLCGGRAYRDYQQKHQQIAQLSQSLSIPDQEVVKEVHRLMEEHKSLYKTYQQQKRALLEARAEVLYNQGERYEGHVIVAKIFPQEDFKDIQTLASLLVEKPNTLALLATVNDKAQVVFSRSKALEFNMNQLFKEVISFIDGKGGGNPQTAQGGGSLVANLEGLMETAVNKLKREYQW